MQTYVNFMHIYMNICILKGVSLMFEHANAVPFCLCVFRAMGHGRGLGPCRPMGPKAHDMTTTQKTFHIPDPPPHRAQGKITLCGETPITSL